MGSRSNTTARALLAASLLLAACGDDPAPARPDMAAPADQGQDLAVVDMEVAADLAPDASDSDLGATDQAPDLLEDIDMSPDMEPDMAPDMEQDMEQDMGPVVDDLSPENASFEGATFAPWTINGYFGVPNWSLDPTEPGRGDGAVWLALRLPPRGSSLYTSAQAALQIPADAPLAAGDVLTVELTAHTLPGRPAPLFIGGSLRSPLGESAMSWTRSLPAGSDTTLSFTKTIQPWDVGQPHSVSINALIDVNIADQDVSFAAFDAVRVTRTRAAAAPAPAPSPVNFGFEAAALPEELFVYGIYGWSAQMMGAAIVSHHSATVLPQRAAEGQNVMELSFLGDDDRELPQSPQELTDARAARRAAPQPFISSITSLPVLRAEAGKSYEVRAKLSRRADVKDDHVVRLGLKLGQTTRHVDIADLDTTWQPFSVCVLATLDQEPLSVVISGELIDASLNRTLVDDVSVVEVPSCNN